MMRRKKAINSKTLELIFQKTTWTCHYKMLVNLLCVMMTRHVPMAAFALIILSHVKAPGSVKLFLSTIQGNMNLYVAVMA